ncbi:MAG: hypothetical protein RDU25_00465 [Patescibacteria group bacterium]|nr:hypothetical protein [Patescibacteria group bacterium]
MPDEDVIEVGFYEQEGQLQGFITHDPQKRDKLALIQKKLIRGNGAWLMRAPLPGEKWSCLVRKDTRPDKPRSGVVFVIPQRPISMLAFTACGGTLVVANDPLDSLLVRPMLLGLLDEVVEKVELPSDGSALAVQVDMGRPVGFSAVVRAPQIAYDECCLFALRAGHDKPSRIMVERPTEISSLIYLLANPCLQPSPRPSYHLAEMLVGKIIQPEPWRVKSEARLETSFGYWSRRAFWYDIASMGDPFESTWQEVVENRWRKDAHLTASAETPEDEESLSDVIA